MIIELSKDERLIILYFIKMIFEKTKNIDECKGIDYIEKLAWEFKLEHSLAENFNETIAFLILEDSEENIKSFLEDIIKYFVNEESLVNNEVWDYIDYLGLNIEKTTLVNKDPLPSYSIWSQDLESVIRRKADNVTVVDKVQEDKKANQISHTTETTIVEEKMTLPPIKESEIIDYAPINIPETRIINNEILFKDI